MKTLKLLLLVTALIPMGSAMAAALDDGSLLPIASDTVAAAPASALAESTKAPEAKENTALLACKQAAAFKYHSDMMRIEYNEMQVVISHDDAGVRKMRRQNEFHEEMMVCEHDHKDESK